VKQQRVLVLGKKAFPKIPHLPGSRTGRADRVAPPELARRCTEQARKGDTVIVQEKLDGSCVAIARVNGAIVGIGREGFRADESLNPGRQMFARWVGRNEARFLELLRDGEWLAGEWLALAHSTRYQLTHEPFVAFDVFSADGPLDTPRLEERLRGLLARPHLLHAGSALSIAEADARLGLHGHHGAIDPVEGAMWRIERAGRVLHRAKFVRAGKTDGAYLPENSGKPALWNWTDSTGAGPGAQGTL